MCTVYLLCQTTCGAYTMKWWHCSRQASSFASACSGAMIESSSDTCKYFNLYFSISTRCFLHMILLFITDRVNTGGICNRLRPFVRLFPIYLSNRLTFGLGLLQVCGSLPWLAGIETEGHRSRSRRGRSDLDPRSRTVFWFIYDDDQ